MKIDPKPLYRHSLAAEPCSVSVVQKPRDGYTVRVVIKVNGRTQRLFLTTAEAVALRFDIGMALCGPH